MSAAVSYLDSSAIVKVVLGEPNSDDVRAWLRGRRQATSLLGVAEAMRAVRRRVPAGLPLALSLLERMERVPLGSDVVVTAGLLDPAALRTLDALHLASALVLEETLEAFVTYDRQLGAAARAAGLPVVAPGH